MSPEVRRRRRARTWRRLRRLLRQRPSLGIVGGVALLVLLGVAWSLWRSFSVAQDLDDVERNAQILRAALVRGDADGAHQALERYQSAADDAARGTGGLTWQVFEAVPVLGDDAEGIGTAAAVLAEIGRDGLPPLVAAADDVTARTFHPEGQQFPLRRIARLEDPAQRSERAFARAGDRLAAVQPDDLLGPVRGKYVQLAQLVEDARATLDAAYRAARLMPSMLGVDGPRDYLLVLQNNAELRSSGGLPGSVSRVHAEDGRVEIVDQLDMAELGASTEPILPLSGEERALFGPLLGRTGVNATVTPHFPRAADLIRARWDSQQDAGVDGVLFVDPVAVSYLLRATGPVEVPGHGAVTAANVVERVENTIYLEQQRPAEHSAFQNAVAKAVFRAFAGGRGEPVAVIRGLATAVDEGRVRMHSFDAEDQRAIAGTPIAGEVAKRPEEGPTVGFYVNDAGQTKLSYYLHYDAVLAARSCTGGVQDLVGSVTFTSDTPSDVAALPPTVVGTRQGGQQRVTSYLVSPVGGEIVRVDLGEGPREPSVRTWRGRQVAVLTILLEPEETQTVEYVVRTGRGQTADTELLVTPNAHPGSASRTARTAC